MSRIDIAYEKYGWEVDPIICMYCGSPKSIEQDHVPPLSRRDDFRLLGGDVFLIVPCCKSCNMILNSCLTLTIEDRKEILNSRIMERFFKEVKAKESEWTMDEFLELGKNLQSVVIENVKGAHNNKANELLARVKYQAGVNECERYIKRVKGNTIVALDMKKEMIYRMDKEKFELLNAQGLAYNLKHKITKLFLRKANSTIKAVSFEDSI